MITCKYCFIVPVYNHHNFIKATLEKLMPYGLPVFLIDDGSIKECATILDGLANIYKAVHLIRLSENQGKGAAVMTGIKVAEAAGFTHGLQIDADGQHDTNDIPKFIKCSKAHPQSLISGKPIYDDSIPKSRFYGRYLTHIWVWVETLSLSIQDSMCGFRIYPLQKCVAFFKIHALGKRMDFDTEIMVRLYWQGVSIHFIPTQIIYPSNGVSHFDNVADNILITKMHTRLFFGMIWRMPRLLLRKLSQ